MKAGSRASVQPEQASRRAGSRASVQAEQPEQPKLPSSRAETTGGRPRQLKIWWSVPKLHSLERKHLVR